MEMAEFWLLEKQLTHKLFKVLVPRYEQISNSYTKMYHVSRDYPGMCYQRSVLELRGNPYPSFILDFAFNRSCIINILLGEVKKENQHEKLSRFIAGSGNINRLS